MYACCKEFGELELLPGALCINSNLQLLLINIEHEVLPIEDCATGMSEEPQESFYTTMCTAYVTSSSMAALKLAPGTLQYDAGRKRPWVIFLATSLHGCSYAGARPRNRMPCCQDVLSYFPPHYLLTPHVTLLQLLCLSNE